MQHIRTAVGTHLLKNYAGPSSSISLYHSHLQLRKSFYEYFKSKNHEILKSASVIPDKNDGTLLFTNAGMNQFKNLLLTSTEPRRIANIQKCIRAGGKHNDLDDVGKDLHHQTFFEMMGNWSFNDAFSKEEACQFAWKYLVEVLGISSDRLYVSYFGGIESLGLAEDHECREIWRKIGVSGDRILPDPLRQVGGRDASRLVNVDDSVVEIWNIVFMSNVRDSSGQVHSLGKNHVDTGMGFERLLSVVQGKHSNFDTDVFTPILEKISNLTNARLKYNGSLSSREDAAFVLSPITLVRPHLQLVMAPYQTERTRGSSHALSDLIPTVVSTMKEVYPEIRNNADNVKRIFQDEETLFWKTVDRAKKMFDSVATECKASVFSGKQAFNLFETYGLPLSVTVELARNIGKSVDEQEFERCQLEAQELSKKASQLKMPISAHDFPTHSDKSKYEYSLENGKYYIPHVYSRILAVYRDQEKVHRLDSNEKGFIVLENCQFYAEQGGQMSDSGHLMIGETEVFQVENAKKVAGGAVTVLFGQAIQPIQRDLRVEQRLDEKRREGLMRAHSATHLLNWALRKSGLGCGQKGSSVDCDRLRFDYSTAEKPFDKERRTEMLQQCEEKMREFIRKMENLQSDVKEEKIGGSSVRVVSLGTGDDLPIECCSGTHVLDVNTINDVAIISDKSMGHRLRRIIAVTGEEAKECREYVEQIIEKLKAKEGKERAILAKKIDWKRVPLVDQSRISALVKQKQKKKINLNPHSP
ncbi:unnamed protein product [Caenorhabditis sp. 36 PRJEB53466]|nr:unnamed protein product [Caenorhabditis sp. 36 PRJEB53466]